MADESYLNVRCPICRAPAEPYLEKKGFQIDRCPCCGFAFVRNVPSRLRLSAIYTNYYSEASIEKRPLRKRLTKKLENWFRARLIERYAGSRRRRLLEIGCGEGHLLKPLTQGAVFEEVVGLDYDGAMMGRLNSAGFNARAGDLGEQNFPAGHFDFIAGLHVVEHVHNLENFIKEVLRILAPGGRVYFSTPCLSHYAAVWAGRRWRYFGPPGHLWYFTVKAMKMFLSAHGFNVISANCFSSRSHLTAVAEKCDVGGV